MKKLLIVLSIVFASMNVIGNSNHIVNKVSNANSVDIQLSSTASYYSGIDNGWYSADVVVGYQTYTLSVYVENNSVTKIDFGNGGSVHSGYNNSGYLYSGGQLRFNKDYSGNIIGARTTVTVTEGYNVSYYRVSIE